MINVWSTIKLKLRSRDKRREEFMGNWLMFRWRLEIWMGLMIMH